MGTSCQPPGSRRAAQRRRGPRRRGHGSVPRRDSSRTELASALTKREFTTGPLGVPRRVQALAVAQSDGHLQWLTSRPLTAAGLLDEARDALERGQGLVVQPERQGQMEHQRGVGGPSIPVNTSGSTARSRSRRSAEVLVDEAVVNASQRPWRNGWQLSARRGCPWPRGCGRGTAATRSDRPDPAGRGRPTPGATLRYRPGSSRLPYHPRAKPSALEKPPARRSRRLCRSASSPRRREALRGGSDWRKYASHRHTATKLIRTPAHRAASSRDAGDPEHAGTAVNSHSRLAARGRRRRSGNARDQGRPASRAKLPRPLAQLPPRRLPC